jgi:putative addiction module CopG family antidote
MRKLKLRLTDDLSRFVYAQVAGGEYKNRSEVVRDAVRLLRARAKALRDYEVTSPLASSHPDTTA